MNFKTTVTDDSIVGIISGFPGQGKTTCGLDIISKILKERTQRLNLVDNIYYYDDGRLTKDVWTLRDSARLIDEGFFNAFNQNAMRRQSKQLAIALNATRNHHNIWLFCLSEIQRGTAPIRERATWWIHIPRQGKAILFVRQKLLTTQDPWVLDDLLKAKTERRINILMRFNPNYITTFRFNKLPVKKFAKYESYKEEAHKIMARKEQMAEQYQAVDQTIFDEIKEAISNGTISEVGGAAGIKSFLVRQYQMHPSAAKTYEKEYYKYISRQRMLEQMENRGESDGGE